MLLDSVRDPLLEPQVGGWAAVMEPTVKQELRVPIASCQNLKTFEGGEMLARKREELLCSLEYGTE